MLDAQYVNPTLVELYDVECGWSVDRQFYLDLADKKPIKILDLGCGTGLLCDAYANQGHDVVGVDPSSEMLKFAHQKPNASKIEWVNQEAQDFRSDYLFDLVIMTGHAFQVLQDRRSICEVLKAMTRHLAQGGIAAFESRNPAIDWKTRWESSIRKLPYQGQTVIGSTKVVDANESHVSFEKTTGLAMTF